MFYLGFDELRENMVGNCHRADSKFVRTSTPTPGAGARARKFGGYHLKVAGAEEGGEVPADKPIFRASDGFPGRTVLGAWPAPEAITAQSPLGRSETTQADSRAVALDSILPPANDISSKPA